MTGGAQAPERVWRERKKAAAGGDTMQVSIALQIVLSLEGVTCSEITARPPIEAVYCSTFVFSRAS
jgi:hypothetical protein